MNFFQEFLRTIEEYREPRRLASSNIAVFAALILSLFVGYKTLGIFLKERAINGDMKKLEEQVMKDKATNNLLGNEIAQTHTLEVIEKLAKEQLNLQKPGELVTVIVNPSSNTGPQPSPAPSLWQRIKSLFAR